MARNFLVQFVSVAQHLNSIVVNLLILDFAECLGYEALCFNSYEIIKFPGCNGFAQCPSIEKACIRPYVDNNGVLPICKYQNH